MAHDLQWDSETIILENTAVYVLSETAVEYHTPLPKTMHREDQNNTRILHPFGKEQTNGPHDDRKQDGTSDLPEFVNEMYGWQIAYV